MTAPLMAERLGIPCSSAHPETPRCVNGLYVDGTFGAGGYPRAIIGALRA
jgi:16S rRNA C1402 N4-methylase RsmH